MYNCIVYRNLLCEYIYPFLYYNKNFFCFVFRLQDQKQFGENVEKWVAGLAAAERNIAKKLLKRCACAFVTNNRIQGRTDMVKHEIDTGKARTNKTDTQNHIAGEA